MHLFDQGYMILLWSLNLWCHVSSDVQPHVYLEHLSVLKDKIRYITSCMHVCGCARFVALVSVCLDLWRNTQYREQKRGVIVGAVKDTVWTMLSLRTVTLILCSGSHSTCSFSQNSSLYTKMLGFSVLC